MDTENHVASCREEPQGAFYIVQWVGLPPMKAFNYLSKWRPVLPPSPKSSSVLILGLHAGLWWPPRALGISHTLVIIPAAFEAEIPILTKIWYGDQRLASGTDQDQTMLRATFCLSFPPHPFPCCVFLPLFSSSIEFPTRQGPHVPLPWRDLDQKQCQQKLCESSLCGDPPLSLFCSLKDCSENTGLVQHHSEPVKGHSVLQAGAKGLETRCRCGFASERGVGWELMKGKTHPSPISTVQSSTMSPATQCSHKATQLFWWVQGLSSTQTHCFSCCRVKPCPFCAAAGPVCHGDSGDGKQERGGCPRDHGTARDLGGKWLPWPTWL